MLDSSSELAAIDEDAVRSFGCYHGTHVGQGITPFVSHPWAPPVTRPPSTMALSPDLKNQRNFETLVWHPSVPSCYC